jgi:uncharacterized protein (TIGR02246 family)
MVNLSNTVPPLIHKWSKAISLMNPKLMADFYCENAVLVGTYSKPYEIGKKQILKYFEDFLNNESMTCVINEQTCQKIGNLCVSSGIYTFTINGESIEARFSFVCIPRNGQMKILNHHSSVYER